MPQAATRRERERGGRKLVMRRQDFKKEEALALYIRLFMGHEQPLCKISLNAIINIARSIRFALMSGNCFVVDALSTAINTNNNNNNINNNKTDTRSWELRLRLRISPTHLSFAFRIAVFMNIPLSLWGCQLAV